MDKEQIIAELKELQNNYLTLEQAANILSVNVENPATAQHLTGEHVAYNASRELLTNLIKRIENDSE